MEHLRPTLSLTISVFQYVSMFVLSACACGALALTAFALAGILPWLEFPVTLDGVPVESAGIVIQTGVTLLLVSMCFLIPTNQRVMKLENAHHAFSIRMEDVARAYAISHAADRKGLFHCHSEFDAVNERINYLLSHPDLGRLEPDILQVAAQMSRISEDLANTYSDDRVDRACDFLRQRQKEIEQFQERLNHAKALHADIKQWANRIELDEAVARSQLKRLIEEMDDVLPELKADIQSVEREDGLVQIKNIATKLSAPR